VPEPPPADMAPSCAEAGVLGVLPGIIGSIEAIEVVKLILDLGDSLSGRLLAYDALEAEFRTFNVQRDPNCPACSLDPDDIVIAEYDDLCLPHVAEPPAS
jgi:molybdopterin/thiamine biosynthesis adenylyltransferase